MPNIPNALPQLVPLLDLHRTLVGLVGLDLRTSHTLPNSHNLLPLPSGMDVVP